MQLSGGDMRRVLNLLQCTHLSHSEVSEETVYLTAGAALPVVIDEILVSMLNDSFNDAYSKLLERIRAFGE